MGKRICFPHNEMEAGLVVSIPTYYSQIGCHAPVATIHFPAFNAEFPQTLPAHWRTLRDAWDGFHAASSALALLAFLLLLLATLHDTRPSRSLREATTEQKDS
jgi:hypothetical protein